jgi:hypothetical protein
MRYSTTAKTNSTGVNRMISAAARYGAMGFVVRWLMSR